MDGESPYWFLLVKDAVTFLFTGIGIIIASQGLHTWKKQIKGTKEFEIAYGLNLAVLKLRDAVRFVRNPWIWPSESQRAIQLLKERNPALSDRELKKGEHAYVYEIRWERITSAYTEVESQLLGAEVLWGKGIVALVEPLDKKIGELNVYLRQHFQPEFRTKDPTEIHDAVYSQAAGRLEHDRFSKQITDCIAPISTYLKDKMR